MRGHPVWKNGYGHTAYWCLGCGTVRAQSYAGYLNPHLGWFMVEDREALPHVPCRDCGILPADEPTRKDAR